MHRDVEIVENKIQGDVILKDTEKKIILWGAGEVCGHILKNNEVKDVAFIVDNDPQKSGSLFHGIPVLHPSKITEWTSYKIILAMNRKNGFTVADQLEQYGLKKWEDFEIWDYECNRIRQYGEWEDGRP